jgi:SOS-response transcriptional repressor LexA
MGFSSAEIQATNSKLSLVGEILRRQGSCRLKVSGSSMLPTLWPGDLVMIEHKSLSEILPGDVVLYQRDGRFFLHRLESVRMDHSGVLIMIRGDAMPQHDPPVSPDQLLGVLAGVWSDGHWVSLPRQMRGFSRGVSALARRSTLFSQLLLRVYACLNAYVFSREQMAEAS